MITHYFINITVSLQCVPTKVTYNIRQNKPLKYDTNVEDYNSKNISDGVRILSPVI